MPILVNDAAMRFGVIANHVLADSLTATFIVKGAFQLRPDATVEQIPEDDHPFLDGDVPWADDPARGLRSASDFAPHKPGTDLLLAAHCHAPGGRPAPFVQVSFGVGSFRKPAVVIGDRLIRKGVVGPGVSEPTPFRQMCLDWSRAYGGPGFAANPVGRGITDNALLDGKAVRMAPNVQAPQGPGSDPLHNPLPIGFGPVAPERPERMSRVGTFDGSWLKERWPWYPEDFDWRYFSAAPADQYLHDIFLRGDEPLEFVNMHPEHSVFRTQLAGVRARCFFRRREGDRLGFEEVLLRLDTLFADLDSGLVQLTWRGVARAATMKLREFEEFFVLVEPIAAPLGRSTEDYLALYEKRRREIEAEFEVPPVIIVPPVMPVISPLSTAWADRLDVLIQKIRSEANADILSPVDVNGATGAPLPSFVMPPPPPMPKTSAEVKAIMKADQDAFARIDSRIPDAYPMPDLSEFDDPDDPAAMDEEAPASEIESTPFEERWSRERVIARLAEGGSFERQDLARLDLSNLCFDRVLMAGAGLDDCDLSGSTFVDTDLRGASMRESRLAGALLEGAHLDEADLGDILAAGVKFTGASMRETDLTGADLAGGQFDQIRAPRAIFSGSKLARASFLEASLDRADFSGSDIQGVHFDQASLVGADLDGCDARGAHFDRAQARNLRASKTAFDGASFRACMADEAVMEESRLVDADFREAHLRLATLTASNLLRAVFALADLREAKLDEVDATEATFVGVDLFRGTLEGATLDRARFDNCNLFQVELYQASLEKTIFRDVNLKGTKREA